MKTFQFHLLRPFSDFFQNCRGFSFSRILALCLSLTLCVGADFGLTPGVKIPGLEVGGMEALLNFGTLNSSSCFAQTAAETPAVQPSPLQKEKDSPALEVSQTFPKTELSEFHFHEAPPRSGTGMRLKQTKPNAFQMSMTSAADFGSEWIYADFEYESHAQQKLTFRVKGRPENGGAFFHPILVVQEGDRRRTVTGPRISTNGGDYRLYVLGLDTDFQLGDGKYSLAGMHFSFNSEREPLDKELSVEIDGLRFANADEVACRSRLDVTVCRTTPESIRGFTDFALPKSEAPNWMAGTSGKPELAQSLKKLLKKPIALYFDLDNSDLKPDISTDRWEIEGAEYAGDFSYRKLLLENCPVFSLARTPEEADVLIYQRTTPSPDAEKLAELAQAGKPLILYGEIQDPTLAELSPLKLTRLPRDQFAPRDPLSVSQALNAVLEKQEIQNCSFGRYFDAELAPEAAVLLQFSKSGMPYLAQKGNVLHTAGTSGTTLLPSRAFYDKMLLVLCAHLADVPQPLALLNHLEALVPDSPILTRNGQKWYRTTNGFGRFGWLANEPCLVDSVSEDLTIQNGNQMYRFDVPQRANAVSATLTGTCSDVRKTLQLAFPALDGTPPGRTQLSISLLTPFSVWQFAAGETSIFLTQENIAEFAAWQTADGVKLVSLKDISDSNLLFDVKRDGHWTAPWLLLFREANSKPLLVVFARQPQKISLKSRFDVLEGFEISLPEAKDSEPHTISAGWLWGMEERNLSGWGKELPAEALEKIRWGVDQGLCFPADRTEFFSLDPENEKIHLQTKVHFVRIPNDWKMEARPFVCLPPLTAFMLQEGKAGRLDAEMVQTSEELLDTDVLTPFGPMLGKYGESIQWSLPLPDFRDLLFVRVKDESLNALQDEIFLEGIQWSSGGGTPLEAFQPAQPSSKWRDPNISHFTWNFGMGPALQARLVLSPEGKRKLERRTAIRYLEPMELYHFKAFARHRSEPFSGLCYPVLFRNIYPNTAKYEPNFASQVIYADTNEAVTVASWAGQELADIWGMADTVRANWNFYRYVNRHQYFIDDYLFQAGSCRESGAGAWIDMLNAEYPGMLAYARLAEIAGDEREYAEAMCRAAKKAVPTIARLYFNEWMKKMKPDLEDKKFLVTGFGEEGAKPMFFPTDSGNFCYSNDLFDFSQGIPGTQFHLYRKFAWKPIQKYLSELAFPALVEKKDRATFYYLSALGLYFDDLEKTAQFARWAYENPKNEMRRDWPGMCCPFQIACLQWRYQNRLAFTSFRNLDFKSAELNPETRTLEAELSAEPDSFLELHSEIPPKSAARNGESISLPESGRHTYLIPLIPGENRLTISF